MGNSGSQTTSLATSVVVGSGTIDHRTHPIGEQHAWVQSYPRTSQRLNAVGASGSRVLPQVATPPRLRATNNGEILYNGGTISGRQNHQQRDRHPRRGRSMPATDGGERRQAATREPVRRTSNATNSSPASDTASRLKRYGSVPDMRVNEVTNHERCQERQPNAVAAAAARKKYKAPPPPATPATERPITISETNKSMLPSAATRRARLFKTRAEMNKKRSPAPAPPPNTATATTHCERVESSEERRAPNGLVQPRMLSDMGRSKSLPEFQAELRAITARLGRANRETPPPQKPQETQDLNKQSQPTKQFYFYGMNKDNETTVEKTVTSVQTYTPNNVADFPLSNDVADDCSVVSSKFDCTINIAPQLRPILPKKQYEVPRFSPAAAWRQLSSLDVERQNEARRNKNTITLNSTYDYEATVDCDEDSADDYEEDGVVGEPEQTRCDAPLPYGHLSETRRTSATVPTENGVIQTTACDDSGISGDGDISPTTNEDHQIRHRRTFNHSSHKEQEVLSWTPEQDLDGDDSNSDDNFNREHMNELNGDVNETTRLVVTAAANSSGAVVTTRFALRTGHVFSLSLPRDNRVQNTEKHEFLRQRSPHERQTRTPATTTQTGTNQSDNWFLSRSAPNSLNHGPTSLEQHNEPGRLMYLPPAPAVPAKINEVDRSREQQDARRQRQQQYRDRSASTIKQARSCENLSIRPNQPQNLQDTPSTSMVFTSRVTVNKNDRNGKPPPQQPQQQQRQILSKSSAASAVAAVAAAAQRKTRRFTFQSTVRQIERRRLAERLSREVERKERQRLNELAAMQRVEEEFQRKRAREKANIRQQLLLYNRTEGGSGEYVDDDEDGEDEEDLRSPLRPMGNERSRPEPDGCCDGDGMDETTRIHADPPPATQVLSEYRLPRREYMEWQRSSSPVAGATINDTPSATGLIPPLTTSSVATVHPKVVCDMPRATQQRQHDHDNNYRRNFAHGVRSHASPVAS